LHAVGTGVNTVILAGTTSGARGNWRLTTSDGTNFVAGIFLGIGGATNTPIPSRDPATPNDEWVYGGIYPGNSNGADSSYGRYTASAPFTANYAADSTYTAPADPFTYLEKYRADFIGDVDANSGDSLRTGPASAPFFLTTARPFPGQHGVGGQLDRRRQHGV